MRLGQNILRLRKEAGLTQKLLSEQMGVSFQTVSKWERELSCPDITLLPALADILGVSVDTLLGHDPGEMANTNFYSRYRSEEYYWGLEPTPFCYQILEKYPPSRPLRLLEIGCGEGRDAVFFARNGYDVSAYDIVPDGVLKAQKLAGLHCVPLNAFCADMLNFVPGTEYDIVYASRALHYLPAERREDFFAAYKRQTRPGGLHAFMVIVDKPFVPAPPDDDPQVYLMKSGEIFTYYHDWRFLLFEEKIIGCNSSGVDHQHCVNLMMAVKPE